MLPPLHQVLHSARHMIGDRDGHRIVVEGSLALLGDARAVSAHFHQQLSQTRVSRFGDGAAGDALTGRMLRRHEPQPQRERTGQLKPGEHAPDGIP